MTRNERELALLLAAAAQRIDELENDPPSPTEEVLLREKVEKLEQERDTARSMADSYGTRIAEVERERDALEAEVRSLRLAVESWRRAAAKDAAKIAELEAEVKRWKRNDTMMSVRVEELERENSRLRLQIAELGGSADGR